MLVNIKHLLISNKTVNPRFEKCNKPAVTEIQYMYKEILGS